MTTQYPSIPVLQGFARNEEGMLSVWCPYCGTFHHHGIGEGHRSAHCTNENSPLQQTGYIVKKIVYKAGKNRYLTTADM